MLTSTTVTTPADKKPLFGVMGHVGAGHVHSHKGFVQDDSGGFAAAVSLIKLVYSVDTSIRRVSCRKGTVEVETVDGGIGKAFARRGFTAYEEELLQRAVGRDGIYSQSLACRCFGRIYGQGVMEAPVAFQTAICNAVIDTLQKKYPESMFVSEEGLDSNVGKCLGTLIEVSGSCVAVMAVVNASDGGIGPIEDLEGNICLAEKGSLMGKLGLDKIPTIIIEGKAYIPALSSQLEQNTFWIRYNKEFDNPAVGDALIEASHRCALPTRSSDSAYPRFTGEMRNATVALGQRITAIGKEIEASAGARDKANLIAELALLVSQDAGGITFMTNDLHEIVAGGGLVPGLSAVLSIAVSSKYINENPIPEITPEDIGNYLKIIVDALGSMSDYTVQSATYLERKKNFNAESLDSLIKS